MGTLLLAGVLLLVSAGFLCGWSSWSPRPQPEPVLRPTPAMATHAAAVRPGNAIGEQDLASALDDARAAIRFDQRLDLGEAKAFAAIEALQASQLPAAFSAAISQARTSSNERLIDIILDRWARLDPPAAVAACADAFHSDPDNFLNRTRTPLRHLAHADPAAAYEAWQNHWSPLDKDHDNSTEFELANVFEIWARLDFGTAFETYSSAIASGERPLGDHANYAVRGIAKGSSAEHQGAMLSLVEQTGDPAMLAEARKSIVSQMTRAGDIEEAAAWLEALDADPGERAPLENAFAKEWFQSDQHGAAAWLMERSDDANRPQRLKELVSTWADWEPNAAGEWLGTMLERHGSQADQAIAEFARTVAAKDPGSALEWLAVMSDADGRQRAAERIGSEWARRHPGLDLEDFLAHSTLSQADRDAMRNGMESGER